MNLKFQPHKWVLVFVLLFAILSIVTENMTVDIHLHDTYYIILNRDLFLGSALLLFLIWMITLLIQKLAVSTLFTWLHIIITILSLTIFLVISLNYSLTTSDLKTNKTIRSVQELSMLLFIIAQILFIINLAIGTIKTFKKKRIEG